MLTFLIPLLVPDLGAQHAPHLSLTLKLRHVCLSLSNIVSNAYVSHLDVHRSFTAHPTAGSGGGHKACD